MTILRLLVVMWCLLAPLAASAADEPRTLDAPNKSAAAFVEAAGDYRLTAAVPAGGKGPASDRPEVKVDRAGVERPASGVRSAGAYQFRPKE